MKKRVKNTERSAKPVVINKVIVPRQNTILNISLAVIAFLSLMVNIILTCRIAFPKADISAFDLSLRYDDRAWKNFQYFDSLYVFFKIYNRGNQSTSINSVKINLEDPGDSTLFVQQTIIRVPDYLRPEESQSVMFKLDIVRIASSPSTTISKYKLPYVEAIKTQNLVDINRITDSLGIGYLSVPLEREIQLKIVVHYGSGKDFEKSETVKYIWPIDIPFWIEKEGNSK